MPVPARRKSKTKSKVKHVNNMIKKLMEYNICNNCKKAKIAFHICKSCGYYNEKENIKK